MEVQVQAGALMGGEYSVRRRTIWIRLTLAGLIGPGVLELVEAVKAQHAWLRAFPALEDRRRVEARHRLEDIAQAAATTAGGQTRRRCIQLSLVVPTRSLRASFFCTGSTRDEFISHPCPALVVLLRYAVLAAGLCERRASSSSTGVRSAPCTRLDTGQVGP
ncbi:hypothetical protein BC628DRAFT_1370080 [Trametes gibbosa]|nr:hypothetical protein BC628DRAFT_1370080 [Trametes gibbosa]